MLHDLLSLLFPRICYACKGVLSRGEDFICTDCNIKLPYTEYHVHGGAAENQLLQRFWGKVPLRFAFSYLHFRAKGRVQHLLHELKYRGAQELGEHLGFRYGSLLSDHHYALQLDLVLPVPLHQSKLRKRGYNQSDSVAEGMARALQLPWHQQVLERTLNTATQTKKGRLERWQNVEDIFVVRQPELVQGKRILLVDDVLTTGATLEACAVALLAAGCEEVSVATIAAA
ncbi:ComF family protein [Pontibacter beigongshangensis]|uniref:ComF family protein n=1 Tax=Pontibacter beigongshangensis TaxID=2574733 RepID=UPI0016503494|nr:ComF family protein [Pontibacter beigongshangensis]